MSYYDLQGNRRSERNKDKPQKDYNENRKYNSSKRSSKKKGDDPATAPKDVVARGSKPRQDASKDSVEKVKQKYRKNNVNKKSSKAKKKTLAQKILPHKKSSNKTSSPDISLSYEWPLPVDSDNDPGDRSSQARLNNSVEIPINMI